MTMMLAFFHCSGNLYSLRTPFAMLVNSVTCFFGRCFSAMLVMLSGPGTFRLLNALIMSVISSGEAGSRC